MRYLYKLLMLHFCTVLKDDAFRIYFLMLLIIVFQFPDHMRAEGSREMNPNGSNIELRLVLYDDGWTSSGQRIPFALVGCADKYQLNIYISDPATEKIYLGFNYDPAGGNLFFQLRDPDSVVVPGFSLQPMPTFASSTGYINNLGEAIIGPTFGAINPGGYKPLVITPAKAGNYILEFASNVSGGGFGGNGNNRIIDLFDVSVYNGNIEKKGRAWCRAWQFSDFESGTKDATDFYIY